MADPVDYLAAWGLADAPHRLIAQRENRVYRVETGAGPVALRLHRAGYRSRAELQSELDWMAVLARGGLPVPAPVPARDGRMCVEIDGIAGDVLSWIDGAPMGIDGRLAKLEDMPGTYRALGAAMARLHDLSDAWQPPAGFSRPSWDADGLLGDAPLWGRFWDNPLLNPDQRRLFSAVREVARARLSDADLTADYGLIHADLVPENVMLGPQGLTMIDFDDGGWGYRSFELATAANRTLREDRSQVLIAALLDGYASRREIAPSELLLFQALRGFTYVGWIVPRLDEPGVSQRVERVLSTADRLARKFLQEDGGSRA